MYQFRVLAFGLNLSPWAFSRLIDAVMARFRQVSESPSSNYLDDLLLRNQVASTLEADRDSLIRLLDRLGFITNLGKSDLVPSRRFVHLSMEFLTDLNRVRLPEARIQTVVSLSRQLAQTGTASAGVWLQLLGLLSAAANLIPLRRLHARPLQLHGWVGAIGWN